MGGAGIGLLLWGIAILSAYLWWERACEANAMMRGEEDQGELSPEHPLRM